MNQIHKAHTAFKAGYYNQAFQVGTVAPYGGGGTVSSLETVRLRSLLLAEVLPRFLEVSGAGELKPGENPSQFLVRLADEATAKGDWDKVQRVLDAYRLSAFASRAPAWLQGEITACAAFLTGQNFEKAGQFALAVSSYQNVLRQSGSKHAPLKEAGERLAAIKKAHPEAFAAVPKEAELRDVESPVRPGPRPVTAP